MRMIIAGAAAAAVMTTGFAATAQTRVTLKSAKSTSSYYQMMVQLADAFETGSDGQLLPTVEESQGSVQNVKEGGRRGGNFIFTSPPGLVSKAIENAEPFDDNADYGRIRSLFTVPYLTMHWVVDASAGIEDFAGLSGKKFIPGGKGSFGDRMTRSTFETLGVTGVDFVEVELNSATAALQNGQVAGFATAGSYPAPNVLEVAASHDVKLLSLTDEQIAKLGDPDMVEIPAGTYAGIDYPVRTLSLPVGAYSTTDMDDDTAYALTKAFWENREQMAETNRWWTGITPDTLNSMAAPLHPGAARYYEEADTEIPEKLKQ